MQIDSYSYTYPNCEKIATLVLDVFLDGVPRCPSR